MYQRIRLTTTYNKNEDHSQLGRGEINNKRDQVRVHATQSQVGHPFMSNW